MDPGVNPMIRLQACNYKKILLVFKSFVNTSVI